MNILQALRNTSVKMKEYVDKHIFQADWNQNDETALDYVKNKTHYEYNKTSIQKYGFTNEEIKSKELISKAIMGAYKLIDEPSLIPKDKELLLDILFDNIQYSSQDENCTYSESWIETDNTDVNDVRWIDLKQENRTICIILIVYSDSFTLSGITMNKGVWCFSSSMSNYIKRTSYLSLSYEDTLVELKQLDEKFIPNTIARTEYVDTALSSLESGDVIVKESEHSSTADTATNAEHATSADNATTADEATKAMQDGNGNVITDTYARIDEVVLTTEQDLTYEQIEQVRTNLKIGGYNWHHIPYSESYPDTLYAAGDTTVADWDLAQSAKKESGTSYFYTLVSYMYQLAKAATEPSPLVYNVNLYANNIPNLFQKVVETGGLKYNTQLQLLINTDSNIFTERTIKFAWLYYDEEDDEYTFYADMARYRSLVFTSDGEITWDNLNCTIDSTLTGAYRPADAKAVGDALALKANIEDISNGTTIVKEAEHAATADEATKATQDGNGNVITDTYETKEDASAKLEEAKGYTDTAVANLVNSAPETLDTLGELATAFNENAEVVEALDIAITNKADKDHVHSWNDLEDKPFDEIVEKDMIIDSYSHTFTKRLDGSSESGYNWVVTENLIINDTEHINWTEGELITVLWNGVEYICEVWLGKGIYRIDIDDVHTVKLPSESNTTFVIRPGDNEYWDTLPDGMNVGDEEEFSVTFSMYRGSVETVIKQIDEKYIPNTIARKEDIPQEQIQSDWNESDSSSSAYIQNKPFGIEMKVASWTFIPETMTRYDVANGRYEPIDGYWSNYNGSTYEGYFLVKINGENYTVLENIQLDDYYAMYHSVACGMGNLYLRTRNIEDDNGEHIFLGCYYSESSGLSGLIVLIDDTLAALETFTLEVIPLDYYGIKKLDEKFIPDEVRVESLKYNITEVEQLQARENIGVSQHRFPELFITDKITGYNYIISMINGKIFYESLCSGEIFVEQMSTQAFYGVNDTFNTDGLIIAAYCEDGSTKEIVNYKCSNIDENGEVIITYIENGSEYTTTVNVEIIEYLGDFTYTSNEDGTVTITGWKGTLNGVPSTEMVFPNDPRVIL